MTDYSTWKVGDKVVCVKRDLWVGSPSGLEGDGPSFKEVCTIREIRPVRGEVAIKIDGYDVFFTAYRFRRVVPRKTDISVFTAMLNKTGVDA